MSNPRYAPGSRHGWIDTLCSRLERVAWGQRADQILAERHNLPMFGGLVVLPQWLWVHPAINVGRKAETGGGSVLLPVRIGRACGSVVVVPDGHCEIVDWTADGMGVAESAATSVTAAPLAAAGRITDPRQADVAVPSVTREELLAGLKDLSADGHRARWEVLLGLEPYVKAAVNDAHGYVCAELAGPDSTSRPVLDHTGLQQVADSMLLGENIQSKTPSAVARLVEKCLSEHTFRRVDPLRYIRVALRRDAEQAIRVSIGDPRIGPKVRNVQRELRTTDLQEILDVYRSRYPNDELGTRRAAAALATPALIAPASLPHAELFDRVDPGWRG